jgi:hypothetical protein
VDDPASLAFLLCQRCLVPVVFSPLVSLLAGEPVSLVDVVVLVAVSVPVLSAGTVVLVSASAGVFVSAVVAVGAASLAASTLGVVVVAAGVEAAGATSAVVCRDSSGRRRGGRRDIQCGGELLGPGGEQVIEQGPLVEQTGEWQARGVGRGVRVDVAIEEVADQVVGRLENVGHRLREVGGGGSLTIVPRSETNPKVTLSAGAMMASPRAFRFE